MGSISSALSWFMEQVGFAICHQLPERALSYGGRPLPVCARDTGLFIGFAVCAVALLAAYGARPRRFPRPSRAAALAAFAVPGLVDALTSYAGLRESNNTVRLATGALAGVGLAALVFPLASSALFGNDREGRPPAPGGDGEPVEGAPGNVLPGVFEKWWTVAALLLIPAAVTCLPRPGGAWAYWLWSPVVTASVIFTFLALNATLIALIFERLRRGRRPATWLLAAMSAAAVCVELALSNGLHRLALALL